MCCAETMISQTNNGGCQTGARPHIGPYRLHPSADCAGAKLLHDNALTAERDPTRRGSLTVTDIDSEVLRMGMDGCSAPNYALHWQPRITA